MGYTSGVGEDLDEVAAAVADPIRRGILELLRDRPLPAGRIAEAFPVSRPAVSRHLRVLRECGLIRDTVTGRERHYRLEPDRLGALGAWLAGFAAPAAAPAAGWNHLLDALDTEVHRARRDHRRGGPVADRQERTA